MMAPKSSALALAAIGFASLLGGCGAPDPKGVEAPVMPAAGDGLGSFPGSLGRTRASLAEVDGRQILMVGEAVIGHVPAPDWRGPKHTFSAQTVEGGGWYYESDGADHPANHVLLNVDGQKYLYWVDFGHHSSVEHLLRFDDLAPPR